MACAFTAPAEIVSLKHAAHLAEVFFNAAYGQKMAKPKLVWNGRQLTTDRLFSPFYVYNHPKGGFVIMAADNKAFPILAYSITQHFKREQLGEIENDLLKKYAREIELVRYDTRDTPRAVEAWRDIPGYVTRMLSNPYSTPEYDALTPDDKEAIEEIDRRNGWIAMPGALEYEIYNPRDYRDITLDDVTAEQQEEYVPFSFFEEFIKEIREEELAREGALEEILAPTRPVVESLGGAHFSIRFPETLRMMRVYSLDGARKIEKYYKDSDTVNVDLSALPPGFYAAMFLTDAGKVYGVKLYR